MSKFILTMSCLTTSNFPWFMGPNLPDSYAILLQHQTVLSPPVTSTAGCCFCFGSASSFPLELFLHSSPVAYQTPTYWVLIFQCHIFFTFHTVHGILKARVLKWFAIPFSSALHFARLSTMTRPSWVALHSMAHSFTELDKVVVHVISLVSFLCFMVSFCLPPGGWG